MIRKIVVLAMIATLSISLLACGGGENPNNESSKNNNTVTGADTSATLPEDDAENVKNYEDTFTGLAEYIIENGEVNTMADKSCYTVSFELEDYYAMGEVELMAITNGSAAECESIYVQGSTYRYVKVSQDYATLIVKADGSFTFENEFASTAAHRIYTYDVSVTANDYTNETEFVCLIYDADTYELIKTADTPEDDNYGRNTTDVHKLLDRAAISLATVNLSLDSLGFTSYEPDMERATKNKEWFEQQMGWSDENEDESSNAGSSSSDNTGTGGGYDMPLEGENFSDYVQRVDPELYDSITERYHELTD